MHYILYLTMTNEDLGKWQDKGMKIETQDESVKATYMIHDLVEKVICLTGLRASSIGQYSGNVYTVKVEPDSQIETIYSSSKVLNEQLGKLIDDKKTPCLIKISKVKNYYSI